MRRSATVHLPGRVVEIQAVDKQAQTLLDLVTHINAQLDIARRLRKQKSGLLTREEKQYVDDSFQGTESSLHHVATLLEPCRLAMNPLDDSSLRRELMFTLRGRPSIQVTLASLGIASQTLNTVVGVLFGKEGRNNIPSTRSYSADSTQPPPSYEESTLLRTRRRTLLGRTDSGEELEEPANGTAGRHELFFSNSSEHTSSGKPPAAVCLPYRPGHIPPSLKPGRDTLIADAGVLHGRGEPTRRMSEMPSETTSHSPSAASVLTGNISGASKNSLPMSPFEISTGSRQPAVTNLQSSVSTSSSTNSTLHAPNAAKTPLVQLNSHRSSSTIPATQPGVQQSEPSTISTHGPSTFSTPKPAPPGAQDSSSAVNRGVLHQPEAPQLSQPRSLREQDPTATDPTDGRAISRGNLPSQLRQRSQQYETGYTPMSSSGQGKGIESQASPKVPEVRPSRANRGEPISAPAMYHSSSDLTGESSDMAPMQPPSTSGVFAHPSRQHSITPKELPLRHETRDSCDPVTEEDQVALSQPGSQVVPQPLLHNRRHPATIRPHDTQHAGSWLSAQNASSTQNLRGNDSTSLGAAPMTASEQRSKRFIEFQADAAPELYIQRSPKFAPEVVYHSAPEVVPLPRPALDCSLPEVVPLSSPSVDRAPPHSPPKTAPVVTEPARPTHGPTEVWNASMARNRPRRTTTPSSRIDENNPTESVLSSGNSSPMSTPSLPALTPMLSVDRSSVLTGFAGGLPRPKSISDAASVRSMTTTTSSGASASALTGKARSQRWREAQYEKFESL